jgi:hypothetical protein
MPKTHTQLSLFLTPVGSPGANHCFAFVRQVVLRSLTGERWVQQVQPMRASGYWSKCWERGFAIVATGGSNDLLVSGQQCQCDLT